MSEVETAIVDWAQLVREHEDPDEPEPEYEFSNGRTFDREPNRGVYAPE